MSQFDLDIAIFQYSIIWENKKANLEKIESWLIKERTEADLLVLPEMFTTGFCMQAAILAEPNDGETIKKVKYWAKRFNIAICGSFIASEKDRFYNRAFFITPEGDSFFYDKRHLFSIGAEHCVFSSGNQKRIISYKGWNICLQICYDLRFPVWIRNRNNEYDLLLYVANWPSSRITSWNILLPARAIENQVYVCGVNRVGEDEMENKYSGCSAIYGAKGNMLAGFEQGEEGIKKVTVSLSTLNQFRNKFPVWKDADQFELLT